MKSEMKSEMNENEQEAIDDTPMTEAEVKGYALAANVLKFPTKHSPSIYRMYCVIPHSRRGAFETLLGDMVEALYREFDARGYPPAPVKPQETANIALGGVQ